MIIEIEAEKPSKNEVTVWIIPGMSEKDMFPVLSFASVMALGDFVLLKTPAPSSANTHCTTAACATSA